MPTSAAPPRACHTESLQDFPNRPLISRDLDPQPVVYQMGRRAVAGTPTPGGRPIVLRTGFPGPRPCGRIPEPGRQGSEEVPSEEEGSRRFDVSHCWATFAGVAEWQTRWIQNPVSLGSCGFKSHLRYFLQGKGLRRRAATRRRRFPRTFPRSFRCPPAPFPSTPARSEPAYPVVSLSPQRRQCPVVAAHACPIGFCNPGLV